MIDAEPWGKSEQIDRGHRLDDRKNHVAAAAQNQVREGVIALADHAERAAGGDLTKEFLAVGDQCNDRYGGRQQERWPPAAVKQQQGQVGEQNGYEEVPA